MDLSNTELFPATFFIGNRQRLRQSLESNDHANSMLTLLTANGLLQRNADNTFPFAQDSNFWYLTGIELPDIILVIDADEEYLIVPSRSTGREAFDGAIDTAALSRRSGISTIYDETDGWQRLEHRARKIKQLATPLALPSYVEQYGMYANPARARLATRLQEISATVELIDIRKELASLRMIKQACELTALQRTIDITLDSLQLLTEPSRFETYKNEYQIEADLTCEFRFRGASGHAFAPIIAGGKRAVTLHNVSNEAPLTSGSLVVLDVGAEVSHYAADITRTRAYGAATTRQQQIFDAVLDVQAYALGLLKPGTLLKDYEQAVENYMGITLQSLGLIKTADKESIRHYFPHATSHFLGLDVHDVGDYSRPLEVDTVVTCEPGIYIPEEGIGVRIEDDIRITTAGNEVLSSRLPRALK